ncbi:uncharacterized protein BXZ73DRAFT_87020 [Epithele typhae]|uniref:uncharacterized protein n=1 Tax=Epithele typhae TaxID=378194 RepID=UPI0020078CAA|nr:uncharacterized protein BXZ73DRAFT_87020 [Epithele typhae]KAH9944048.1 hypothetical protein BXZ73DRAFT_87020 [Epithele typhae]
MTTAALPLPLQDVISPKFHQNNFAEESYIKNELGIKLDKDDQICRLSLTPQGCPLGPLHCPLRHTHPPATVCKHWLRGLCKKGDACEFLHEYNLRRMPECWWYAKYGYCSAGDDERKVECPDYNRGFCKLGPTCPRKHVRRVVCKLYLTGFCPMGPDCSRGHPKANIPPPKAYDPPEPPSVRDLGPPPPGYGRYADFDRGGGGGSFPGPHAPGAGGSGGLPGPRRNLEDVVCYKCGEKGHYANHCRHHSHKPYKR